MAQPSADRVAEEVTYTLDLGTAAGMKVLEDYWPHRDRERDISGVALQAAKEWGAGLSHAVAMFEKARLGYDTEEVDEHHKDSREEVTHFQYYKDILDWLLQGEPCPIEDLYDYGDFSAEPLVPLVPTKKVQRRWPASYEYFTGSFNLAKTSSPWVREVIHAVGRESGGLQSVLALMPKRDEFTQRVVEAASNIMVDELGHGPQHLKELAPECPSDEELQDAKEKLLKIRALALRYINEQFRFPRTEEELQQIEQDMREGRIGPVNFYRPALATSGKSG